MNDTSSTSTTAVSLQIAVQPSPSPINTINNVYATGGGVIGPDSATICSKITTGGQTMERRNISTLLGRIEAREAHNNHTTINWDADGGRGYARVIWWVKSAPGS